MRPKVRFKKHYSEGEELIALHLRLKHIGYQREKTFPWLLSSKKAHLRLDFYLPKYKKAIEFDGIYHFGKGNKRQKQNDTMKNLLCAQNGITLLRIPYWQKRYIKNILARFLR